MRIEVVVDLAHHERRDRPQQCGGHGDADADRDRPALVLRGEHEIHEHDREQEDERRAAARCFLLKGQLGPLVAHRRRQLLLGHVLENGERLAGGEAWRRLARDLGRRVDVVVGDGLRTEHLLHLEQRAERDHAAGGASHLQPLDVLRPGPEPAFGLGPDLVDATEEGEVVDVLGAEGGLQGIEHILQRNPH